jgi:hypothetical protein
MDDAEGVLDMSFPAQHDSAEVLQRKTGTPCEFVLRMQC